LVWPVSRANGDRKTDRSDRVITTLVPYTSEFGMITTSEILICQGGPHCLRLFVNDYLHRTSTPSHYKDGDPGKKFL
jgi:hypothetical protein